MDDSVKLTLVEQALQSDYSRKKLDSVSLRQFINHLLLLAQKPRIYLFYKKDKDKWIYAFSTHGDVLYDNQFKDQILEKLHIKVKEHVLYQRPAHEESIWPEEPQKIGQTDFGIILVAIEPKKSTKRREIVYTSPCNLESNNTEYKQLKKLWANFLGCKYSKTLGIEARLKKRLEHIYENPNIEFNNIKLNHNDIKLTLTDKDKDFINLQLTGLSNILDNLYIDICEAPLVSNRGKIPPNIFFFARYYDEPSTVGRFKNGSGFSNNEPYPYSLKIIIPPTQKKHLTDALNNIAKSNKTDFSNSESLSAKQLISEKKWRYCYKPLHGYDQLFPSSACEYNSRYPQNNLDFEFWYKLSLGKTEEILSEIQLPFGAGARSFVDPVLMTGFTHFRSGLYKDSGLERVTKKLVKQGFKSQDIRRLVYLHYLFSAAAPDSNYDNLGSMTVPLNVSNQPFIALVRATVAKDQNDSNYRDEINWPQNYLFYTDIAQHCMSKLRRQSKARYKLEIERLLLQELKKELKIRNKQGNSIYISLKKVERQLNHKLTLLCRVWPFPLVKLTIKRNIKGPRDNFLPIVNAIDPSTGILFYIHNNPYFLGETAQTLSSSAEDAKVLLSLSDVKKPLERALRRLEEAIVLEILKHNQRDKLN